MFRWTDDKHIRARTYDELVWKPALFSAGVIAEPTTDRLGRRQYVASRENGMHALRHYYASITLADGVNIKGVGGVPRARRSWVHTPAVHPHAAVIA
jgi:hypothetical protein